MLACVPVGHTATHPPLDTKCGALQALHVDKEPEIVQLAQLSAQLHDVVVPTITPFWHVWIVSSPGALHREPSNQLSVVTVVALTKPRVRLRPKHVYTDEPTVMYTAAQVATDERHVSKHRLRKTCRVSLVLVELNVKTRSVAEGPLE